MTDANKQYSGGERRSGTHEHLVDSIITALKVHYQPTCLTEQEQQWVRLAIKEQTDRASIRKAIIEKSLAGLVWAALVGLGYMFIDYLKAHGFK
jgi:hypothetical protein